MTVKERTLAGGDRPPDVPDTAVREVAVFLDDDGAPADPDLASVLNLDYFDADGQLVFTVRGRLRDPALDDPTG